MAVGRKRRASRGLGCARAGPAVGSRPVTRPHFAESWPRDARLDALVEKFEEGDYAAVAAGAVELRHHEDARVRAAARRLVSRTRPDPMMKWIFAAMLLAILSVAGYWIVRTH